MWQELNGPWLICHWWHDLSVERITAMIALTLLALMAITVGIILAVQIDHDGYGSRPVPRSHRDPFDPHQRFV
jgi:hypothetical protein